MNVKMPDFFFFSYEATAEKCGNIKLIQHILICIKNFHVSVAKKQTRVYTNKNDKEIVAKIK